MLCSHCKSNLKTSQFWASTSNLMMGVGTAGGGRLRLHYISVENKKNQEQAWHEVHSLVSVLTFVLSETLTKFILLYPKWPPGGTHFLCFDFHAERNTDQVHTALPQMTTRWHAFSLFYSSQSGVLFQNGLFGADFAYICRSGSRRSAACGHTHHSISFIHGYCYQWVCLIPFQSLYFPFAAYFVMHFPFHHKSCGCSHL